MQRVPPLAAWCTGRLATAAVGDRGQRRKQKPVSDAVTMQLLDSETEDILRRRTGESGTIFTGTMYVLCMYYVRTNLFP